MQAAYHAEALGSGTAYLGHAHLVPRATPGSAYPFAYHNPNYGDGSNAPHLYLPAGYNGVAPGAYPSMGADAATAAVVQPQAYALPGFNYTSPFTAALTTPLLNAVQSSLVSASSNTASEMQQVLSSPGQPPALWAPDNTPSCSENGFNVAAAAQQPYAARLQASALQQQQQDPGTAPIGPSAAAMPGFPAMLAPGGYGSAVDVWKHLAMVAATGGVQGAAQVQPGYGTDYQLHMQHQQKQAATAALHAQAAYLQQQQQQAYGAAGPGMASFGAAAAAASLGAAGPGMQLGAGNPPPHLLQLIQQQQQQQQPKLPQQQQQQQPVQAVVTPDSLSDQGLAAAAATALHLLQLPAGLRALAACGMMPHLLQSQQQQQQQQQPPQQAMQQPGGYGPGLLAALLPPFGANAYTPCEPLAAAARAGLGQLPYQLAPGMPAALAAAQQQQQAPRPAYPPVQGVPGVFGQEGPEVSDPRLQHLQNLQPLQQQQQQPILQQQPSQTLPAVQAPQMDLNPSSGFQDQQQQQQQSQAPVPQAERPEPARLSGDVRRVAPASPSARGAVTRAEPLRGSLSAPFPGGDNEPYTEETSSPSPTREPSSAPSAQAGAAGTSQPTSAALLILGLQQQPQQQQQAAVQQMSAYTRVPPDSPPQGLTVGGSDPQLPVRSPRRGPPGPPQLGPPTQLLHFTGLPLQLPLPHAVLACKQPMPVPMPMPALSCPPGPANKGGGLHGTSGACTSTSAPAGAAETRRRTLADRRERRKESNRESARRCRLRREKDTCELSRRVTSQETVNGSMLSQVQRLEHATNVLLDHNNVLEAWLKHIQTAGEGASAAAATILGYVRSLDEQVAAAAAAQLQVVGGGGGGGYLPGDPMVMVQQMQPQTRPEGQQMQPQGWPQDAQAMAAAVAEAGGQGGMFGGGEALAMAAAMRGLAAAGCEPPGGAVRGGSASDSPGSFHHPAAAAATAGGGGGGGAARPLSRMTGVEAGEDDDQCETESEEEEDDDDDGSVDDLEAQM